MEKTLSEALEDLRSDGLTVRPHQIHHALRMGRISRPRLSGSLNYHWNAKGIAELKRYFRNPQRAGRPVKKQSSE